MTTINVQGENLRKAVQWVGEERKKNPERNPMSFVDTACIKFDLSPDDSEFLRRFVKDSGN